MNGYVGRNNTSRSILFLSPLLLLVRWRSGYIHLDIIIIFSCNYGAIVYIQRLDKSNGNSRYFWHSFIHSLQYLWRLPSIKSPSLMYHLHPNVWKATYTISASILVAVPYWPPYSTDKFISCVVPGLSKWLFLFGEETVITWTHIGWVRRMLQNVPLPGS